MIISSSSNILFSGMKTLKKGFYKMRRFPYLGSPDLRLVRVKGIYELGDGSKIVSYTYNWPLPIRKEMEYEEFIKNVVISEL